MLHLEIGSCYQLTQDVHKKLQAIGIVSSVQFIVHDLEELSIKTRVSFRDLLAVRRYLLAKHACVPITGSSLYESVLASTAILSTGCDKLNQLLDGGLYTGELTELCGASAVGKTQISLSISLEVAIETQKDVVYFDIRGTGFCTSRVCEMMQQRNIPIDDYESILRRINVVKIFDVFEIFSELDNLKMDMEKNEHCIKLIVVDSLSPLLWSLKRSESISYTTQIVGILKSLSTDFSFAVLYTTATVPERFQSTPSIRSNVSLDISRKPCKKLDSMNCVRLVTVTRSTRQKTGRSVEVLFDKYGVR